MVRRLSPSWRAIRVAELIPACRVVLYSVRIPDRCNTAQHAVVLEAVMDSNVVGSPCWPPALTYFAQGDRRPSAAAGCVKIVPNITTRAEFPT